MDWNFLIRNKESLFVTTDSRKVTPGCVFVAIKGEHFDGNDFVDQALRDGAAYVIKGENAIAEMQDLARAWRRELGLPVLCITGTNGKTTTKELTAAVLRCKYGDRLLYTQGNLNNSIGVPLTLLSLTRAHEFAIVECGASHPGDIKELVDIAEPNYGLITNVGRAHLQGFGSFEGVQRTKQELYDYLAAHDGIAFRNADNDFLTKMWLAANVEGRPRVDRGSVEGRSTVVYHTGKMPFGTNLVGEYNSENIQAALCVGEYFGVSREEGLAAIRAYVPTNNRSQAMTTERNSLVVDAYNANPTSMQAAICAFFTRLTDSPIHQPQGQLNNKPLAFILGAMRELGEYEKLEHQNIVNMLCERKAENVFLVGKEYQATTAPYPIFDDVDALAAYLEEHPLTGYHILVKGSRGNKLEKILPCL